MYPVCTRELIPTVRNWSGVRFSVPGANFRPMDPIQLGLPHRPPFIFIDEVTAVDSGRSANATKCFSSQEPFLEGHFPGNAIVPGVLLAEALAQTAGIAIGGPGKMFLLTAIRAMKFLRPVRPEEPIDLFAECLGEMNGLAQCAVR